MSSSIAHVVMHARSHLDWDQRCPISASTVYETFDTLRSRDAAPRSPLAWRTGYGFELHQINLWMSIVICIYAGLNAVKTPWRCTTRGGETKPAIPALVQCFVEGRFPGIASDFRWWS